MVRIVAFDAIFFLLPFIAYALWLKLRRGSVTGQEAWTLRVLSYLTLAGGVVMVVALVALVQFDSAGRSGVYHPPEIRDGVIVPGGFDPPPASD